MRTSLAVDLALDGQDAHVAGEAGSCNILRDAIGEILEVRNMQMAAEDGAEGSLSAGQQVVVVILFLPIARAAKDKVAQITPLLAALNAEVGLIERDMLGENNRFIAVEQGFEAGVIRIGDAVRAVIDGGDDDFAEIADAEAEIVRVGSVHIGTVNGCFLMIAGGVEEVVTAEEAVAQGGEIAGIAGIDHIARAAEEVSADLSGIGAGGEKHFLLGGT